MIKKYPYFAPACTDCIRWDTPIAVAASNIPGPRELYSCCTLLVGLESLQLVDEFFTLPNA